MNNPKPDDIRRGEVITASWLNDAKNAGVHEVRFGGGMVGQLIGGKLVISTATDPKPQTPVTFCPWLVKGVSGDYLTCQMDGTGVSSPEQVRIAKPPALRSGAQTWTTFPAYVVDSTVIWAAPCGDTGLVDTNNVPITLMDLNIEGRSAEGFWGLVGTATDDTTNVWTYAITEQVPVAGGFADLTNGRSLTGVRNSIELNNSGSGVQGNSIDLAGQIFTDNANLEVKSILGSPVVWVRRYEISVGTYEYRVQYVNAIDGECA